MAEPEVCDLLKLRGQRRSGELLDRLELLLRGLRRAQKIALVGVREPVRLRPGRGDDGVLVEAVTRRTVKTADMLD